MMINRWISKVTKAETPRSRGNVPAPLARAPRCRGGNRAAFHAGETASARGDERQYHLSCAGLAGPSPQHHIPQNFAGGNFVAELIIAHPVLADQHAASWAGRELAT